MAKFGGLGDEAKVKCWSGGQVIYVGTSTGKVQDKVNSGGTFFQDKASAQLTEVSGVCVLTYDP